MKAWKLSPLAVALISVNSYAVEPTGIALGSGVTFLPVVDLTVENNSNIYSTPEDEIDDTITRLTPSFTFQSDFGKTKANATYRAEQGFYGEDKNDDYLDHNLSADVSYEINARQEVSGNASYNDAHDPRGAGTVEGAGSAAVVPDEYEEITGGVNYVYGTDSSTGNIEVYADSYQKRYSNNEAAGTSDRDHNKLNFGAILSLTASPDAEFILEAKQTNITYSENTAKAEAREGYEQRMFAGMRWDITGATTGEIKVGRSVRFFDDSSISSNMRIAWEANLTWEPLTYSSVVLSSSQSSNETNDAGSYIANTYSSVSWDHEFSSYYSAGLKASISSDAYVDDAAGREDDLVSYGINGTYSPINWMDVTLDVSQSEKTSNINTYEFDQQIIVLGLTLAL
jgi:hypothetical protein